MIHARKIYKTFKKSVFEPFAGNNYVDRAPLEPGQKKMFDFFIDLIQEEVSLRNITLWADLYTLIGQVNALWNQVIDCARHDYGYSPLRKNLIVDSLRDVAPQLGMVERGDFSTGMLAG